MPCVPALALLFHLIDGGTGPVGKTSLRRAIKWHIYLFAHALRVYSSAVNRAFQSAKSLADKIVAGKIPNGFTVRQVYRNGWSNLNNQEDVNEAIDILQEHGWLKQNFLDTGGRKKQIYMINPKVTG